VDAIFGGLGSDVMYGGPGDDLLEGSSYWSDESIKDVLHGGPGRNLLGGRGGDDVLYGGDGNDNIDGATVDESGHVVRKQRDELYCGEGEDHYTADKLDYVSSSCEVKDPLANM